MSDIIRSYKGFNADMTCKNGFGYEEGKEYETDRAELCSRGRRIFICAGEAPAG